MGQSSCYWNCACASGGLQHLDNDAEQMLDVTSEITWEECSTELLFANDIAGSDATNIQSTSVNDDETPTNNKESVPAATNQKKKKKTEKSLKNIGEELLNSYRYNMTTNEWSKELEYKKLELEKRRLDFEIAKYKFENPTFQFD